MVFTTIVIAGCFVLLFQFVPNLSKFFSGSPDVVTTKDVERGLPFRIKIPSINVDAAIEKMGIEKDGSLEAPEAPENAGWYEHGPRPGQKGVAVIDGHFGWIGGLPSVFDHLSEVKKGDLITIVDNTGTTTSFIVRETASYDWDADFSNVFTSTDQKARLNLITCGGIWNTETQTYEKRLVVFAEMI